MPASSRLPSVLATAALVLGLALGLVLIVVGVGASPARAEGEDAAPVRLVIATSGLTWEDVSEETTPALQCLADRSGLGAMNTTSTSAVSTTRQGMETLRTGYRGLAETAPRTAGIPSPALDQWEQLGVPVGEVDADAGDAGDAATVTRTIAGTLDQGGIVLADVGGLPARGDPGRSAALAELDTRIGAVLDTAGGCEGAELPRTLLVSVAATDPEHPEQVETGAAVASRTAGLQVALDSSLPGTALTSGATKQDGLIALTDVLPTVLASHRAQPEGPIPGQPVQGRPTPDAQQLVVDRSQAARMVDAATVPAIASWALPGALGLLALLVPALARRPRLAATSRALATLSLLALPVGLYASVVPWWRAEHPVLALTGVVWAGSALLAALVLLGPWRRVRRGPLGVAAALVAGLILLESATGSRFQLSSPLGAQPISGGRYYGLSNHLFGLVLGATLVALLCLFTHLRTARARTLWTVGVGAVVAVVCVAPSMGADFGSMLVTVPTLGLLALLVSGVRLRLWHLLALGLGGAALVSAVSVLDWLRPPEDRTHLGRVIEDLLSGQLLAVVVRKLAQNLAMSINYPGLTVLLVVAVALSVVLLVPRRIGARRLTALDAAHPSAYAVRIALVVGTWLGFLVNDTGPVLVAAVLAVWLAYLPVALPDPRWIGADGRERPALTR